MSWVFVGLSLAGDLEYQATVTAARSVVVPRAGVVDSPAWVTGTTYANSNYVKADGRVFMCLYSPGTASTNAPRDVAGCAALVDGYRWVPVSRYLRQGIVVSAVSGTNDLYVAGIALTSPKGSVTFSGPECPQGELGALTAQGTNTVSVFTWGRQ